MNPEQWQQIKTLFNEAVELDAAARERLFETVADAGLVAEVRRLLAAEELNRFAAPVADVARLWPDEPGEDLTGARIGDYTIRREIGRGGMGVVFEALREKEDFSQTVALKLLKRGMDSDAMLRRFRHERQILAALEHPHIARLLDGGMSADGRSFFAMEYVDGRPLDEYCDANNLGVRERLRLFLQICAAVRFAHSRLVVHRDLKPSNILVRADGTVKLLDFGIAKILSSEDDAPAQTVTALGMMTPRYASPEQIRGEFVSTASDIYSLGLILYELLTGAAAYEFPNNRPDEMARVICEAEPPRPSSVVSGQYSRPASETANDEHQTTSRTRRTNPKSEIRNPKSLKGDLDNIVLKALRKDPARRYASVEQFGEDIRRHLDGRPVIARPDTLSYRFEKFVARNRAAVVAGFLVFLSLVGGIAATSWQAYRAERQRQLAEKRFEQVRELARNVVFKYHDEIKDLQGATRVRQVLVEDALKYLDNLQADSGGDADLTRELAQAYMRVGSVQGGAYQANLGDSKGAAESYEKAIRLLEPLAERSTDVRLLAVLRDAYTESSRVFYRIGAVDRQNENLRKALPLAARIVALAPGESEPKIYYSRALVHYGDSIPESEPARKLETYREGLRIIDEVLAAAPDDETANRMLATATHRLQQHLSGRADKAGRSGDADQRKKLYEEALGFARRSADAQNKVLSMSPGNPLYQRNVAGAKLNLGKIYRELGDPENALRLAAEALQIQTAIADRDPNNQEIRLDLKETYEDTALAYVKRGEFGPAFANFEKAAELTENLLKKDPENFDFWIARLRGEQVFADALLDRGAKKEAQRIYREALARAETRAPEKYAAWVADFRTQLGESLRKCE